MKKILAFLSLATFIACNNNQNKDTGVVGKWMSEELVTKTKRITAASKDSLIAADFAQIKAQMITQNGSFSVDDSISLINESTKIVNQLFGLSYELKDDKSFVISFPGYEDTVRQTGKYTLDEKNKSLILKIDSMNMNNPAKERTVKYELANGKLSLTIDDSTTQLFKKIN